MIDNLSLDVVESTEHENGRGGEPRPLETPRTVTTLHGDSNTVSSGPRIRIKPMLVFEPDEAEKFGLNEAIILSQFRYWLTKPHHDQQERDWIYNSYEQWQDQFPFWSERTVRRTIKSLEDQGVIVSEMREVSRGFTCKWYRLSDSVSMTSGHDGHRELSTQDTGGVQNGQLIYKEQKTTQKTTTEENIPRLSPEQIQFKPIAAQVQEIIRSAVLGKPPKNDPEETCVILEQLVRLDGIPAVELVNLAHWIARDEFWKINAPSVLQWRNRKGKDAPHKAMQCYVRMMSERAGPPSRQSRKLADESEYRDL